LEGLELGGYSGGEGADCYVADVAEEMFNADFFCFFCLNYGGCVYEGFGCGGAVVFDFFHGKICISWYADFGGLNVDDDK